MGEILLKSKRLKKKIIGGKRNCGEKRGMSIEPLLKKYF